MKRLLILTAVIATAVAVFVAVTLPPRRLSLAPAADGTIPGILHVHTSRSDGLSSTDEVAAAAARAGLKFLVFTDHGDGTRTPDPPTYRAGVLCLDGVEISTSGGHYVALDMPAAPYPLAGDPRGVVEDVRRLGGFGIVAHPDSPKPQLRWRDWDTAFDGIELLNLDTSWRLLAAQPGWRSKWRLATALVDYPFRSPEVIGSLIQPTAALERWASAAANRRVVIIAGADAHARLSLRYADPRESGFAIPVPGYEAAFRVISVRVRPDEPFNGDPRRDGAILMRAIRNGHLYTAVDSLASPPSFEFTATNGHGTVHAGDELAPSGPLMLRVRSNAPPGLTTVVHDGATTIAAARDTPDLAVHGSDRPGVYWAEIVDAASLPPRTWIRSNPIYVRGSERMGRPPAHQPAESTVPMFDGRTTTSWRVEHDAMSASAVEVGFAGSTSELRFRYGLAGGAVAGQVVALVRDIPTGVEGYDRLTFRIRSERPMRISVQLRDAANNRWQRSVYVDPTPQDRTLPFEDFTPVGETPWPRLTPADVRNILFAVDATHTRPGSSGRIWVGSLALER